MVNKSSKRFGRITFLLLTTTILVSLIPIVPIVEVLAGGEENIDPFNVNPLKRWTNADEGSITNTTEESQYKIASSTWESQSIISRRLQKTKGTLEGKVQLPNTNSRFNFGLSANNPTTCDYSTERSYIEDHDLMAHWEFSREEYNQPDSSGRGHDLSFENEACWEISYSSYAGYCGDFSNPGHCHLDDHDDFSFVDESGDLPFSIEAWIYCNNIDYDLTYTIASKYSAGHREYYFIVQNQRLYFVLFSQGSTNTCYKKSNTVLQNNTWYHVVGSYDGSADHNGISLYENAVKVNDFMSQGTSGNYLYMSNLDRKFSIGELSSSHYFEGHMDDVKIWKKELTIDEILRSYHEASPAKALDLKMNENTGSIAYDSSGNDYDFTIYSPTSYEESFSNEAHNALSFDGTTDSRLKKGDENDLDVDYDFSLEFYVTTTNLDTPEHGIICKGIAVANSYMVWRFGTNLYVRIRNSTNSVFTTKALNFFSIINTWYSCFITLNSSGWINIFRNGIDITDIIVRDQVLGTLNGNGNDIEIGKYVSTKIWKGKMDEFHIYKRAYTSTEIAYRYANTSKLLIGRHLPIQDHEGESVRIVVERNYQSGDMEAYGAFEDYNSYTWKSESQIVYPYTYASELWLNFKLKYDTKKSTYSFELEYLNGTEILDCDHFDIVNNLPSISDSSQFFVFLSFQTSEKTSTTWNVDWVKAPFREQEFKKISETESGAGNIFMDYRGFQVNNQTGICDKIQEWDIDIPFLDSVSGTVVTNGEDLNHWSLPVPPLIDIVGEYLITAYAVYPSNGTMIEVCYFGVQVWACREAYHDMKTSWSGYPFRRAFNSSTIDVAFTAHYDKSNNIFKVQLSSEEYIDSWIHEFETWNPTEFVFRHKLIGMSKSTVSMTNGGYGGHYTEELLDWSLKSRDLLDLLPSLPVPNLEGIAQETLMVGNLLVILIRGISNMVTQALIQVEFLAQLVVSISFLLTSVQAIYTYLTTLPTAIWNKFSAALTTINTSITAVTTAITNLPANIYSQFSTVLNSIDNTLGNLPSNIYSQFSSILNSIEDMINNLPANVFSAFETILDNIDSLLGNLPSTIFTAFETMLTNIYNTVAGFVVGVIQEFIDRLGAIWDAVVLLLAGWIQDFIDELQTAWGDFTIWLSGIFDWLLSIIFPADIYTFLVSLASIEWTRTIEALVNLWDLITGLAIFSWLILTFYLFTYPFLVCEFKIGESIGLMGRNMAGSKGITVFGFYLGLPTGAYWLVITIVLGYWSWVLPFGVI